MKTNLFLSYCHFFILLSVFLAVTYLHIGHFGTIEILVKVCFREKNNLV